MKVVKSVKDAKGLQQLYINSNLSVTEFCSKLGISTPTYYDLIKKKTKTISPRIHESIKQFIKISKSANQVMVISNVERNITISRVGDLIIRGFALLPTKNQLDIMEGITRSYLFGTDPFSEVRPTDAKGEIKKS